MAVQERLYTADDLWELSHRSEYADKRLELASGRLLVMPLNSIQHGVLASEVALVIGRYVRDSQQGYCLSGGTGYALSSDTVRAPDFAYIPRRRFSSGLPERFVPFAPDFAVEIIDSADLAEDVHQRIGDLLSYGTRLLWVFYPKTRSVVIYTPEVARTIEADGTLDGGDVLSGFSVRLSEIYAVLD